MNPTREVRAVALASRLLDPEDLGFTANAEIRDAARYVMGHGPVETVRRIRPVPTQQFIPDVRSFNGGHRPTIPQPAPESRQSVAGQSRTHSLVESLANVAVGYGVALASQLVIFPMYGIKVSLSTNIAIGLWFTAVSIVRSYVIRRWFNGFKVTT